MQDLFERRLAAFILHVERRVFFRAGKRLDALRFFFSLLFEYVFVVVGVMIVGSVLVDVVVFR